jgi:hypothetical protein
MQPGVRRTGPAVSRWRVCGTLWPVMSVDEFWALIDDACAEVDPAATDFDDRYSAIVQACEDRLSTRKPDEIVEFALRQWHMRDQADLWNLRAAAYVIEGWNSDDGFMDFREGLIALGRVWYERALADPDSLADHPFLRDGGDVVVGNEDLVGAAERAYERVTGESDGLNEALDASPEAVGLRVLTEPKGEKWRTDEEARQRVPRLAAIFRDE